MKINPLLIAGCVFASPLFIHADGFNPNPLGPGEDPLPVLELLLDGEPKIVVMPTEVSLNGIDHPALGRSLSDSLIGGLLAQGGAKVVSFVEGQKEVVPPLRAETAPEALAGILGRRLGAQKVLVPRLVGEDDFYRFTVKEVDAGNYEVIRVFELSHVGDREGIFGFVPLILSEFEKEKRLKNRRNEPVPESSIRIWTWEEFRRDFGGESGEVSAVWPPRANPLELTLPPEIGVEKNMEVEIEEIKVATSVDAEREARARGRAVAEMVALGKVDSVNAQWGFCVIDMTGRRLQPDEKIEIREGESEVVYATLVVKRVEGNKAIADLQSKEKGKKLFKGDLVFGVALGGGK